MRGNKEASNVISHIEFYDGSELIFRIRKSSFDSIMPRKTEVIKINNEMYHISDIIHDYDAKNITMYVRKL